MQLPPGPSSRNTPHEIARKEARVEDAVNDFKARFGLLKPNEEPIPPRVIHLQEGSAERKLAEANVLMDQLPASVKRRNKVARMRKLSKTLETALEMISEIKDAQDPEMAELLAVKASVLNTAIKACTSLRTSMDRIYDKVKAQTTNNVQVNVTRGGVCVKAPAPKEVLIQAPALPKIRPSPAPDETAAKSPSGLEEVE